MKCIHINIRKASFILLSLLIQHTHMLDNAMDVPVKQEIKNVIINKDNERIDDEVLPCVVEDIPCSDLNPLCMNCNFTNNCIYGQTINVSCEAKDYPARCRGPRKFQKSLTCQYCYQTEQWEHKCELKADCHSIIKSKNVYQTNCTVHDNILCLGQRTFYKKVKCNWTRGYRWSTTLALSIGLGGFGADRFYLGHWQEGIGKLFSFGGLGVWTLIDVILISLHYLGPADGSLYI